MASCLWPQAAEQAFTAAAGGVPWPIDAGRCQLVPRARPEPDGRDRQPCRPHGRGRARGRGHLEPSGRRGHDPLRRPGPRARLPRALGRCRHAAAGRPGSASTTSCCVTASTGTRPAGADGGGRPGRAGDPARGHTPAGLDGQKLQALVRGFAAKLHAWRAILGGGAGGDGAAPIGRGRTAPS